MRSKPRHRAAPAVRAWYAGRIAAGSAGLVVLVAGSGVLSAGIAHAADPASASVAAASAEAPTASAPEPAAPEPAGVPAPEPAAAPRPAPEPAAPEPAGVPAPKPAAAPRPAPKPAAAPRPAPKPAAAPRPAPKPAAAPRPAAVPTAPGPSGPPPAAAGALTAAGAATLVDVNSSGAADAGDRVDIAWTVHNTGTADVTALTLVAPTLPAGACAKTTLTPAQKTTCRTTHQISGAQVEAGSLTVTYTARGTTNATTVSSPAATATAKLVAKPRLALSQVVILSSDRDGDGRAGSGDSLVFRFTVTNTGNRTLSRLAITDRRLQTAGVAIRCARTILAPGARTTCVSGSYLISRSLAKTGSVSNSAAASAVTSSAQRTSSPASGASVRLVRPPVIVKPRKQPSAAHKAPAHKAPKKPKPPVARLSLDVYIVRAIDRNGDGVAWTGDDVVYGFKVSNVGGLSLTRVAITDGRLVDARVAVTCPVTVLRPGESMTCTSGAAPITSFSARKKLLVNAATVSGVASGRTVTAYDRVEVVLPVSLAVIAGAGVGRLPKTGASLYVPMAAGSGLLLVGGAFVLWSRRRPEVADPARVVVRG